MEAEHGLLCKRFYLGRKTSAGNYYFLDLHSGDGIKKLSHWFEREDFGAVNKAFHFVTGRESEQYLEFGCYRSGSFQIDQLILVEDAAGTASLFFFR